MKTSENPINGAITIIADIPEGTEPPTTGVFKSIEVSNWFGPVDATIPNMVELVLRDGSSLAIWPDGTFVMNPVDSAKGSWSRVITQNDVVPNPFRD